jgi:hypothetical protein
LVANKNEGRKYWILSQLNDVYAPEYSMAHKRNAFDPASTLRTALKCSDCEYTIRASSI